MREAIFPYKGVFFTKVVKANIIAFTKTKILRPILSVKKKPFQKCQPLLQRSMGRVFFESDDDAILRTMMMMKMTAEPGCGLLVCLGNDQHW